MTPLKPGALLREQSLRVWLLSVVCAGRTSPSRSPHLLATPEPGLEQLLSPAGLHGSFPDGLHGVLQHVAGNGHPPSPTPSNQGTAQGIPPSEELGKAERPRATWGHAAGAALHWGRQLAARCSYQRLREGFEHTARCPCQLRLGMPGRPVSSLPVPGLPNGRAALTRGLPTHGTSMRASPWELYLSALLRQPGVR